MPLRRLMIFLLLLAACLSVRGVEGAERRAFWVVRYTLRDSTSIDRMVEQASAAGFDDLFVQVCGRGDAWFPSRVYPVSEPVREAIAAGFDPLAYVLRQAHLKRMRVHAWINTLLVWSAEDKPVQPEHVFNIHRDWMMIDEEGRSLASYGPRGYRRRGITGTFMSPANPAVRKYIEGFVTEIVSNYPVDGVHLDYIRYPMSAVDYGADARRGFHGTYGIDPLKLVREPDNVRKKYGESRYGELCDAWQAVRMGYVSGLVARIKGIVDEKRPGTVLSAAVKPDIVSARSTFGQDWPGWVREGYVQMVLPMAYGTDAARVRAQIEAAVAEVGAEHVWAGLRAWDVPVSSVIERVKQVMPLGPGGICYFSYDGVQNNRRFFDAVRVMRKH